MTVAVTHDEDWIEVTKDLPPDKWPDDCMLAAMVLEKRSLSIITTKAGMPKDICTIFIEDAEGHHQLDDDDLSDQCDSSSSYTGTSCSSSSMRVTDRPGWFRRVYFSSKPGVSLWISCQRGATSLYGGRSKYTLRTYQAVFGNSSYRSLHAFVWCPRSVRIC